MRVVIFGATGMLGQGVLRECLLDPEIVEVLSIARRPTGKTDPKLRELIHKDFLDFSAIEDKLVGYDACFYCLGTTAVGKNEAEYHQLTYGIAIAAAQSLLKTSPGMTFLFISGVGTDSTESGRQMWARVKGKTENEILKMPFKGVYAIRPAFTQPLHGVTSSTKLYRAFSAVVSPLYPVLKGLFPNHVSTTEQLGLAMIYVAKHGAQKRILYPQDINSLPPK